MPLHPATTLPKSQISASQYTTFKVGTYTALTDTFTTVLDLNDRANFWLVTYQLAQPKKLYARVGNIRTPRETVTRWNYQNRHIKASVKVFYPSDVPTLITRLHTLINAIENPPYRLAIALPGATALTYADVVAVTHNIPTDPHKFLALTSGEVQIDFECYPGLAGDRLTLQNLVVNPGFEAPSGPGIQVFNDTFANLNAYTVVSGSAPTQNPANGYPDIIAADAPLRYYRLDEPNTTSGGANDIAGQGYNGSYFGTPTFGVAGAISGDTDTAVTFASASSQYVSCPTASLPVGNNSITMECWAKIAAAPASTVGLMCYGGPTSGGARTILQIILDSTGKLSVDTNGGGATTAVAMTTGAWHHLVATYNGTTVTFYLDGAAQAGAFAPAGGMAIPGSPSLNLAAGTNPSNYYGGSLDEAAFYAGAMSSTRISAHYSAGHTGPTGTVASAMSVPSGTMLAFGSPNWQAVNQWQVRWRYSSGATATFYLHYTDANNQLYVQITQTTLSIYHRVAGVTTLIGSDSFGIWLTLGAWYWVQITQFPSPDTSIAPFVYALLLSDAAGAIGSGIGSAEGKAINGATAVSGAPHIATTSAAMAVGGAYSNVHAASLFGPGGWTFQPITAGASATTPCAGAWEQTAANTYAGGPVTSYGAARIDLAPVGTVDTCWRAYTGGVQYGASAIPVYAATNVLGVSTMVKSTGLNATHATQSLIVLEYDNSGNYLRQTTLASVTGSQAAWMALSGTLTTGASTAYLDVMLRVQDTSVAGESANGTVWFDNVQVWNQTTTGLTTMPYCELRFPQSPAQLMVSGVTGDIPTPAQVAFSAFQSSFNAGATLSFAIGRRIVATPNGQLAGGIFGANILDAASYGGCYQIVASPSSSFGSALSGRLADMAGVYHLYARALTLQSSGNLSNMTSRVESVEGVGLWISNTDTWQFYSAYVPMWSGGYITDTWGMVDAGQVTMPPSTFGVLQDPTQTDYVIYTQMSDSSSSQRDLHWNWQMALPVDGGLLLGTIINASNSNINLSNKWVWGYFDGLGPQTGGAVGWAVSTAISPLPTPNSASGGQGFATSGGISINNAADPYLSLDPTASGVAMGAAAGVNQFAAYITDGALDVLNMHTEFQYVPLYLFPRGS